MEQYPIPQFIESEGKIISFLTFRQFFILVAGGAVCLGFYYLLPFYLFLVLSILVAILVMAVAFLKVDNTSVITILLNFITFSLGSKNYIWKKKESLYPSSIQSSLTKSSKAITGSKTQESKLKSTKQMVEYRKKK